MPTTIFTPQMLRNGTRAVPEIPAGGGGGFTNTYSLDFDGVDDYLDLGASSTVADSGQFTLSFWIKGTSQSAGAKYLFSADYYNLNTFWTIQNTELYWRNINNGYKLLSANLLDGDWHHILIIWNPDGANSTIRCFTDGVNEVNIATDFRYAPGWNGGAYQGGLQYIGNRGGGTFPGFNGNIDEFAAWNDDQSANVSTIYNGGTPNDLTDLSPDYWYRNGDNGSYKSPQWLIPSNENKDKVSNYSFEFDGVDDEIPIRTISQTVGTGNITYSSWIRTSKAGVYQTYQCAFGGYSNGGATYTINKLLTPYNSTDIILSGGGSSIVLNDGNWHNIITTFDVTTKQQLSYVDGVLDRTYTAPSWITHFGICIGAAQAGQYHFEGDVSDCAVFNRVLTQSEATSIYNSGTPNDITPLTPSGYWRISDNSTFSTNWTIPDEAGSFDGTSANMTIEDRIGEAPNSENNALSYNMDEADRVEDVPS